MDKIIEQLTALFNEDKGKIKEFLADPKGMLEKHGIDFDPDKIEDIIAGVKDKIDLEGLEGKGAQILESVKDLFKK